MKAIWKKLKSQYHTFEQARLEVIDLSMRIRRDSKRLVHRVLYEKKTDRVAEIEEIKKNVDALMAELKKNPFLHKVGATAEGLEEYVELVFLEKYRSRSVRALALLPKDIDHEVLISGIADMSGEMVRLARVNMDVEEAQEAHAYLGDLYERFLELEVSRNNKLRAKMSDVLRNVMKLEEIIFELKLKQGT